MRPRASEARPKIYGRKVKLVDNPTGRQQADGPVYGERRVVVQYKVRDLLWRPAGRLVRFVAVGSIPPEAPAS